MIKILLQLDNNKLTVSIKRRLNNNQKALINTNIISQNEIVFSDEYIIENASLVHSFIKELTITNNINTVIVKEFSIAPLILKIITNIKNITNLYLLEESILTYNICNLIIKTNTIKYVSLYNLPTYLLEMLDKENIIVDSRNEILFLSDFMKYNNLEKYSSIYYKVNVELKFPLSKYDEEDFKSFIAINRYLKNIYINKTSKVDIENMLNILYRNKSKNINIYIKENIQDLSLVEYLKNINKKNSKSNKIQFKIMYSDEYLQNNFISQININTIKACIYVTLIFISSVVIIVFYNNYTATLRVEKIQENVSEVIASYKDDASNTIVDNPVVDDEDLVDNEEIDNQGEESEEPLITNMEVASLLSINEDVVGWLKVNNTNVDYAVVQSTDNEYYLTHNLLKENDSSGWIFMDYRADATYLSTNTIIFGHNMFYSGIMFGSLYKTKYSSWYTNEENQIIEFDTLYSKMKWKIFSIYVIDVTNDYLIANFSSDDKYQEFLDLITDRSIYSFNTPVSVEDKILTLTTCSNNGTKRLVIHAVLLDE